MFYKMKNLTISKNLLIYKYPAGRAIAPPTNFAFMFILYVLQSKNDFSFYIGITSNIQRRFKEHNNGLSRSTKSKRPWVIIYCEIYRSRKDAIQRELKLKKHKNAWIKLKERIKNSILSRQN